MKSELPVQKHNAQMEARLRDFTQAVEEITDIVILIDARGIITWVNGSFLKIHGVQSKQVTGNSLAGFLENI